MYTKVILFVFLTIFSITTSSLGQGTGNNPFSQVGLGDLTGNQGNIRNIGMGYAGVSARHHYFINLLNPALLPNLRTPKKSRPNHEYVFYDYYYNQYIDSTVKLDFSLTHHQRSITGATGSENSIGTNLGYISLAFPITKYWSTAVGLSPYSSADYNINYNAPVIGDPSSTTTSSYSGRGGVYKLFFSNGLSLSENLSVGLETAYLFGNITNYSSTILPTVDTKNFGFKRQNAYSALALKPGINFRRGIISSYKDTVKKVLPNKEIIDTVITKTKSTGVFYNIGLTLDYFSTMNVNQDVNLYLLENTNRINLDTTIQSQRFKTILPPTLRLGFSLDKPLKWTLAADVHYADWSRFSPAFATDTLAASYGFTLGGEYSSKQFKLKSKSYRLGFSYLKTPIVINGNQLDEVSLSVGGTVPFGRKNPTNPVLPRVNVALVFGQRGNVGSFGIKEQFVKAYISILINEKWFNKRKIY